MAPAGMLAVLGLLAWSPAVPAEYRVYQYEVVPAGGDGRGARVVTSFLDPVGYAAYHGGRTVVDVRLLRTWACLGHTGGRRPPCPSPFGVFSKADAPADVPADAPARGSGAGPPPAPPGAPPLP